MGWAVLGRAGLSYIAPDRHHRRMTQADRIRRRAFLFAPINRRLARKLYKLAMECDTIREL